MDKFRSWRDQRKRIESAGQNSEFESQDSPWIFLQSPGSDVLKERLASQQPSPRSSLEEQFARGTHDLGLKVFAPGKEPTLDIVAVHGLNGDREKTWTTKDGTLWLRDLLPNQFGDARILTYGYEAQTHGSGHVTVHYLYDHAVSFAYKLAAFRRNTKTARRPLIFIAHSLGGILVKSVLIHSHFSGSNRLPELLDIKLSTYGIFFFGTPHAGSSSASWGLALLNIASVFSKTNTSIIKHLRTNSEWLRQSMDQFNAISCEYEIRYFYEGRKTPLALGKSTLIVPRESAVINGISNPQAMCFSKDHRELVQFETVDDEDYQSIISLLRDMLSKCHDVVARKWKNDDSHLGAERKVNEILGGNSKARMPKLPFRAPIERTEFFVGRENHLKHIQERFGVSARSQHDIKSPSTNGVVVLYGLGGMGKTQLALKYAEEQAGNYSAILWINASTEKNALLGFRDVAQRYANAILEDSDTESRMSRLQTLHLGELVLSNGDVSSDDANLNKVAKAVITLLERSDNDNWLLILDNVDDLRTFSIEEFLPKIPSRQVIITSRLTTATRLGYAIEVDELDEDNAVQVLLNNSVLRTKSPNENEVSKSIAKTLGYLPLALEQAGACISHLQLRIDDYLPMFERHRRELLGRASAMEVYTAKKEAVFTTWEVSFRSIQSQDDDAAQLMLLMAFFHHETLWEDLFLLAADGRTLSPGLFRGSRDFEWLENLCSDMYRFKSAIGKILSVSLGKRGPQADSVYIHPLVHAWGRDRQSPDERFCKEIHALTVIGQALYAVSKKPGDGESWNLRERILLHADACLSFARSDGNTNDFYSLFGEPAVFPSILQIAKLYHDFGRLSQAESLLSSLLCLNSASSLEGIYEDCLVKLADVLVLQGRHEEAEQRYQTILSSASSIEGCETHLQALAGLGRVYWIMCQYDKSEDNLEAVMNRMMSHARKLGPLGQQAASNLSLVYWHKGKLQEALDTIDKVIKEIETDAINNDITALEHHYRRAIILQSLGHLKEAEPIFSLVFIERQNFLGLDNLETCQAANALARHCYILGDYPQARKYFDMAWSGQERIGLGMGHPAVLRTLFNYGVLDREEGLYDEALECLERATLWERKYGSRHHSYLSASIELAILYTYRKRYDRALEVLSTVRQIQQEDYPPEKPECIRATDALADILICTGDLDRAETELDAVLPIAIKYLNPNHHYLLNLQVAMARLRHAQNRGKEAVADLEDTVRRYKVIFSEKHPSVLMAIVLLGQIYHEIGRDMEGEIMIGIGVRDLENILGKEHPKTREVQAICGL